MDTINVRGLPEEQVKLLIDFVDFLKQKTKPQENVKEEWERLCRHGRKRAQELGLKEEDVERLIEEYRSEQSYA
jgi:hypothetical protein